MSKPTPTPISDRDAIRCLDFIRDSVATRGYPPSRREIAYAMRCSSSSKGQDLIDHMVERGMIEVDRHVPRGIRIKAATGVAETETL